MLPNQKGGRMKITKAYCEQSRKVLNIYEAKTYYFSQMKTGNGKRDRLSFLCSSERCRLKVPPVKVTGVLYDKSIEEAEAYKAPHYRENGIHHPKCEWVLNELERLAVAATKSAKDAIENKLPNRYKREGVKKETDLIDCFWLEEQAIGEAEEAVDKNEGTLELDIVEPSTKEGKGMPAITGRGEARIRIPQLVSHELHELVACFQELTPGERKDLPLTMGKGSKQKTYGQCFHSIKHLETRSWLKGVVFYGGARVKPYGKVGYKLTFFDTISIEKGGDTKKIELYLTVKQIQAVPYYGQYIEYLNKAALDKNVYIQCFFYLPNEPRYSYSAERPNKIDILLPSMSHIDLIAKTKVKLNDGNACE